jgi:hypothetical protein
MENISIIKADQDAKRYAAGKREYTDASPMTSSQLIEKQLSSGEYIRCERINSVVPKHFCIQDFSKNKFRKPKGYNWFSGRPPSTFSRCEGCPNRRDVNECQSEPS